MNNITIASTIASTNEPKRLEIRINYDWIIEQIKDCKDTEHVIEKLRSLSKDQK